MRNWNNPPKELFYQLSLASAHKKSNSSLYNHHCLYKTGVTLAWNIVLDNCLANELLSIYLWGWWEHRFARLVITSVATSPRLWARHRVTHKKISSFPSALLLCERRVGCYGQWRITERCPEGTCVRWICTSRSLVCVADGWLFIDVGGVFAEKCSIFEVNFLIGDKVSFVFKVYLCATGGEGSVRTLHHASRNRFPLIKYRRGRHVCSGSRNLRLGKAYLNMFLRRQRFLLYVYVSLISQVWREKKLVGSQIACVEVSWIKGRGLLNLLVSQEAIDSCGE